jgi:hypothetical protein
MKAGADFKMESGGKLSRVVKLSSLSGMVMRDA